MFVAAMATAALPSVALAMEGTDLTIVRVFTGWRDAASFKRISEYFDGKENTGGLTILRTQPDQRGGYYFLVRTANPGGPRSVSARLEVITSATAKPVVHTFPLELKAGETTVQLGLTGSDWPEAGTSPVAWRLDLTDAGGRVLVTEKSYLWEKPAAK
jgi:hypothetical protein